MEMLDEFVEFLINNGIIDNEEKCIYEYGLKQGVLMLINIVTTIIIGIFFGMIIESIVFTFAYIPLRTYAGGYHAKNQLLCYFFSIGMIIVALLGIKIINLFSIVSGVIIMISFISIYIFSPVEDHNKLLSEKEKVIYRKKSIRIFIIEFAIVLMLIIFRQYKIVNSIVMAQFAVAFMILIGKIKQMVI